ncbi:peptidoglycan-binding protein [Bailinhaonella thermotolerans]|uniref:CHAP domain-containing protein n=1 Tax=Bailinhaonella thermotolerans TaxID=1070861 RepID=A0A3A3ZZE7_9ACTN|nr:peptidoglycan-binding protein [Bailinhaonella thermotolerans]RJL19741.1 CHAP domain-containing protein [Bailinhaonella thermotolerans]
MDAARTRLIKAARADLGYRQPVDSRGQKLPTPYGEWYCRAARVSCSAYGPAAWCDMAVSKWAEEAGIAPLVGRFAYTVAHARWFKARGRWSPAPAVGAVVFFDWGRSNDIEKIDHVGIVTDVRGGGVIRTIEANTRREVAERTRGAAEYVGFGHWWRGAPGGSAKPKPKPPASGADTRPPAYPGRLIRQGSRGDHVRTWQRQMIRRGYNLGPTGADGIYGPRSAAAARELQRRARLVVDGIVGPDTWRATWSKGGK